MRVDKEKFNSCYETYHDMLFKIAILYVKNTSDAQDVLQEVFIKYLKYSKPFPSQQDEEKWLIRITINQCKDMLRRFWRRNQNSLEYDIPIQDTDYLWILEAVY